MRKLDIQHKHIIKLISRDKQPDGWTKVSKFLYPHLVKNMPKELIILEKTNESWKAKLTEKGECVLYAMDWL